jgi:hypothetical protein
VESELLAAQAGIISALIEHKSFMHSRDLLLEGLDYSAEYGPHRHMQLGGRTQITGTTEHAVQELIEASVLQQMDSATLLEEVIRNGRYLNDDFPEMKVSELEDADDGGYFVAMGPQLPFFVAENFSELVEISEQFELGALKDYCFEVATLHELGVPASSRLVARDDNSRAMADLDVELAQLEERLCRDNAAAQALADEREVAVLEVGILRRFLAASRVRASVFVALSKKTLGWIADKCAGAAVGEAAKHALIQILRLFS